MLCQAPKPVSSRKPSSRRTGRARTREGKGGRKEHVLLRELVCIKKNNREEEKKEGKEERPGDRSETIPGTERAG